MTNPRKYTSVAGILGRLYAAKLEGMTNDQMTSDCDDAILSFRLRAFFVIRHSCFVISLS